MYTYIVYYYSLIFQNKKGDLQKVSHQFGADEVNTFWHTQLNISFIKGNNNRFESSVIIPFLIAQNRFYRRKRIWKL